MYGEGISKYGELVDLAVKLDIIQKKRLLVLHGRGADWSGQGRRQAVPAG